MSPSQIRCLLAVLALSEAYDHIESKDVAHLLGVKKPTVHRTLGILQEKGLIEKQYYGEVLLSPLGIATARDLEGQRDDLTILFSREYALCPEQSAKAAIVLMGELAKDSVERMRMRKG